MKEAKVLEQTRIGEGIYSLWLEAGDIAVTAKAGQFVSVYSKDQARLLPRPISICRVHREKQALRLVYRVTGPGTGTEEFSKLKANDLVKIMGPLGNGFPLLPEKAMLIGGGIGIPPMVQLAAELKEKQVEVTIVSGYRNHLFLEQELEEQGALYVATEDGSTGTKGTVLDCIREQQLDAEVIYACGPTPMLRAIKDYAVQKNIPCYLSLEEKMACGIGACLACVCQSKEVDAHSHVHNKRICKDGPVFLATEVEL